MNMENRIDQDKIPFRTLYNGDKIPCVGLGTFGSDKYGPEQVGSGVRRGKVRIPSH